MKGRLLLHICCAPDATIPWPELIAEGWETEGYFYGGNIHPRAEYEKRKAAVLTVAQRTAANAKTPDWQTKEWFDFVRGTEKAPEGGARCALCFEKQLDAAAKYAAAHGFTHLCTTLTISPHKNVALINEIGAECCQRHGLIWLERVFRKNNGFKRSVEASREMGLYRQNYCGCIYSLRSRLRKEVDCNEK